MKVTQFTPFKKVVPYRRVGTSDMYVFLLYNKSRGNLLSWPDTPLLTATTTQVHRERNVFTEVITPFGRLRASEEGTGRVDEEQAPERTAPRDGSFGTDTRGMLQS